MNYFNKSAEETLKELNTSREAGLTAAQAEESRKKHGANVIAEEKPKSIFKVFLEQFADLLVIILIIASVISAFTGNIESTIVILAVITINAILGTVQHVKAQKSLASLGVITNVYSIGAFAAGVMFLAAALFITPLHGFMDIDSALTANNIIEITALSVVPFAVTQLLRVIREAVTKKQ